MSKVLRIFNFIVFFIYCFMITLSYQVHKIWGNVNFLYLESFDCPKCIDRWGIMYGGLLLLVCLLFSLLITWGVFYCLNRFYKANKCYCPVFIFLLYLISLGYIIWLVLSHYLYLNLLHISMVWCLMLLFYFVNLWRRYDAHYIFGLLVLAYPAVFFFIVYNQPLLFYSYKELENKCSISNLSQMNKRNLIVVYVESFNRDFSSIFYHGEKIEVDDKEAVHFSYFKEGIEQGATRFALISSFTGLFPSHYYPRHKAIGNFTKNSGYQNLFVQVGDLHFTGTNTFLLKSGFDKENIYGMEDITDTDGCMDYRYKISGHKVSKKEISWWNGTCDSAGFKLFKKKISAFDKKRPFFAVMFTLDLHAGDNPYYETKEEIKAVNINNLNDFIHWFKQQDFYDSTTLVILADHALMYSSNKDKVPLYNAFFNLPPRFIEELNINRTFNQTDMFLTMLEIMGFDLPCKQVGFSTSLFANEKTMAELYSNEDIIDKRDSNLWLLLQKSYVIRDVFYKMVSILSKNISLLWR